MDALGRPATLLVTEHFNHILISFAPTIGMPDYPAVSVPHPVAPLDDENLRRLADTVLDEVVSKLVVT